MRYTASSLIFALAPLVPAAGLMLAALLGGNWVWMAFVSMTVLVLVMDRLLSKLEVGPALAQWLPWAVGGAHFTTLAICLWAVGHNPLLETGEKVLLIVTMGLFAGKFPTPVHMS